MDMLNYSSKEMEQVKERIMRQTLEALIYENMLDVMKNSKEWLFTGKSADGAIVHYSCQASEKWSFGRVKIDQNSIKREGETFTNIYLFLAELIQNHFDSSYTSQFIHELLETLVKDTQSKAFQLDHIPEEDQHYDALESHMVDGHPYHPSYKSRIGFSLLDNLAYGPEFNQAISIYWVAVNEQLIDFTVSKETWFEEIIGHHLTEEERIKFDQIITDNGHKEKSYCLLPVHPWQLEHQIQSIFMQQIINKDILILGTSMNTYRAQQSIRSLANRNNTTAPYMKFPLSITNTSTSRILAHHTTQNAPLISDWLAKVIEHDPLLRKVKFQILKEMVGISFRYEKLNQVQYQSTYGTLGAIYRENVATYLEDHEQAWPLNALSHIQKNGVPFIQKAIDIHGIEKWSEALIEVVTVPIIHLLYAHGIALESHAQNIILVVENDFPTRIIIKDLHDGVRYNPEQLLRPDLAPTLNPEPESHRKVNRYSFIQTQDVSEVRDYTYDAFFFICMTDICFTFEKFGLREQDFWSKCVEVITSYQTDHPQFQDRYDMFQLFSKDALIEEMTKRRIYGDGELHFRKVNNPLLRAMEDLYAKK